MMWLKDQKTFPSNSWAKRKPEMSDQAGHLAHTKWPPPRTKAEFLWVSALQIGTTTKEKLEAPEAWGGDLAEGPEDDTPTQRM